MTGEYFDLDWLRDQPLSDVDLGIMAIEAAAGDDVALRADLIEHDLGWTMQYYEENARCLALETKAAELAPGLVAVMRARYPGDPSGRYWSDAEAFTRRNHA